MYDSTVNKTFIDRIRPKKNGKAGVFLVFARRKTPPKFSVSHFVSSDGRGNKPAVLNP